MPDMAISVKCSYYFDQEIPVDKRPRTDEHETELSVSMEKEAEEKTDEEMVTMFKGLVQAYLSSEIFKLKGEIQVFQLDKFLEFLSSRGYGTISQV